jgi:hypothetical protein
MSIVKVQRPNSLDNPRHPWLIYDKEGRYAQIRESDIQRHIRDQMRGRVDAFFVAEWRDGAWNLLRISHADYGW